MRAHAGPNHDGPIGMPLTPNVWPRARFLVSLEPKVRPGSGKLAERAPFPARNEFGRAQVRPTLGRLAKVAQLAS